MLSKLELVTMYTGIDPESKNRSEHLSDYLKRKYAFTPTNAWFNIYANEVKVKIGNRLVSLPIGTELIFFIQSDIVGQTPIWELVGAGVIENKPGFMKFSPVYLYSSYDGHGAKPGQKIYIYLNGFEFNSDPLITALPFGASVELKTLVATEE